MHINNPSKFIKLGARPCTVFHHAIRRYKIVKATFRAFLCRHQREQRDAFFRELDVSDPAKLFRRANGVTAAPTLVLCVDGTIYKRDELPHAWAKYFKTLISEDAAGY